MELDHLREFLVFAKTLNYSAAAKELYIAQPTLSQHIAKLSQEVGQPLVSQKGAAHLTPAGNVLLLYAQSITAEYEKMMDTFSQMGEQPAEAVRVLDVRISLDIAPAIRAIRRDCPEMPFRVEYEGDKLLFEKGEFQLLDEGLVDVSFVICPGDYRDSFPPDVLEQYEFVPLPPLRGLVVMSNNHPLAQKPLLSAADMTGLNAVVVKTPFWQSSEKSLLEVLGRHGVVLKTMSGSARAKWEVPAYDLNFVSLTFEDSVKLNPVSLGDDLAAMGFDDLDFSVLPYGIYRKDNPNRALPLFIERWREELQKGRF